MFLLCTVAGGGASAPAKGNDMEEDINKHQFRKEVQELGLEGGRVQDGHHTLAFLFLPRSCVCLSEIDPKCNACFSSRSFFFFEAEGRGRLIADWEGRGHGILGSSVTKKYFLLIIASSRIYRI